MSATESHSTESFIACPQCDALYKIAHVEKDQRAVCARCRTVLIAPRRDAGLKIIALALTSLILVLGALFFPFLEIHRLSFWSKASVLDVALAFSDGLLFPLSLAIVCLIIGVPLIRLCLTVYAIAPLVFDRKPLPAARRAFHASEALRPWSMAEIFVLGCAVSLIKLTDLAQVQMGAAFWMFVALVVLMMIQESVLCRWSVWKALER